MSCGLNTKLDAAYTAAREAFDTAHKTNALADNDLNLLFVYYQGIKKLRDAFITQLALEIGQSENDIETNFSVEIDNALANADIPAFPTFGGLNIPIVPVAFLGFGISLIFVVILVFKDGW